MLLTLVVQNWGTEEVAAWLDLLNLGEYKEIFIRHDVRGAELLHLERRDLKVFLFCASLWLLKIFLQYGIFSPVSPLSRAFGLACVLQMHSHLSHLYYSLPCLCAFAMRMSAVFSCQDHSLALTAEAQHAPRNFSLYPLVWLFLS